jgi:hypothetical protein
MKTIIEKATEAVLNTQEKNIRRIPCKLSNNPNREGTVRWEGFLFFPDHPDFDSITVYTHTDSEGIRHIVHSVPLQKSYRGGCPSEKKGWVIVSPNTPTSQIYLNAAVATWEVILNHKII